MKKQLTIFIFVTLSLFSFAQTKKVITTTGPCDQKLFDKYPGLWLPKKYQFTGAGLNQSQQQGWINRFDEFTKILREAYAEPSGCDAFPNAGAYKSFFGNRIKFLANAEEEYLAKNPVMEFAFAVNLYTYYCNGANSFRSGYPDPEMSNCGMGIYANTINAITLGTGGTQFYGDNLWRIDDRPMKLKFPVTGKWKGYDVFEKEGGQLKNMIPAQYVLLTHAGMLPYIPVTRKEYLERAIPYIKKFYAVEFATLDQIPVRSLEEQEAIKNKTTEEYKRKYPGNPGMLKQYLATYSTDQQELERKKSIIQKNMDADLKKYQDELEKTTKNGMLESPAIVAGGVEMMSEQPVFTTEEQGGNMLITENPNYFRKDLPAAVPQIIVLAWWWEGAPWQLRFRKTFEENFPIEELQAMIDK